MKVSLNWLKKYIDLDLSVEKISEILTMIGLEVEGVEEVEPVPGGLKGIVVGEVKTCIKHPNADTLSLTTVDVGGEEALQIVCGAPNVAAGQKVLVATVGTTLYKPDGETWKIKKGKIRGEVSEGMICAEDELGLGTNHDGIMVLDASANVGLPAKEHLNLESDIVYEIGLTPNRSDATGHLGVAKDLAAYLKYNVDSNIAVKVPDVSGFKVNDTTYPIEIKVEDKERCPRYSGITITGVEIKDSPEWMQRALLSIGVRPINNIVDITNYVLHELSQPLHAFDADKIKGKKVIVKTLPESTPFLSLDEVERQLSSEDLMICDGDEKGMCIAGVFGGIESGVTENTRNIFLESAHFSASSLRKTSTRHLLRTDAAKIFEKGSDPNMTVFALKRAAMLMIEYAGGTISSEIEDLYPAIIEKKEIHVRYNNIRRLVGEDIPSEDIHKILRAMEMEIEAVDNDSIMVSVPTNKADVTREVDVIEEILRIYGFNKVEFGSQIKSMVSMEEELDMYAFRNRISDILSNRGYAEMMNLSLVESSTMDDVAISSPEEYVYINNTSNVGLDIMRPEMLVSGLQSVKHNHYRQQSDLKLYEIGRSYIRAEEDYQESEFLTIYQTGKTNQESWLNPSDFSISFHSIKSVVESLLLSIGLQGYQVSELQDNRFDYGLLFHRGKKVIARLGGVSTQLSKKLGIKSSVVAAELPMKSLVDGAGTKVKTVEVSKFPSVRRDLALILDKGRKFSEIASVSQKIGKKLISEVNLFDVYVDDDKVGKDKKSYAVSFIFQDSMKTLKDKEVDKVMNQLLDKFKSDLQAEVR